VSGPSAGEPAGMTLIAPQLTIPAVALDGVTELGA
jgi:hypothetical protein